jgi:meso-butanediol dehydrogenase/(S,S)-butanediol dehydrogenase/diacetyl reductase
VTAPLLRYADKVAVVVGGTAGIGLATVLRLRAEGATVVAAARDAERGRRNLDAAGAPDVTVVAVDVTDEERVDALFAEVGADHGRVDVVVNSAGVLWVERFDTMAHRSWEKVLRTNLDGPVRVCRAALPWLRAAVARPGASGSAAIVNVCSLDAVAADKGMSAYNAAKAGLLNFTRALALELAPEGIRANVVSPGAIDTDMTAAATRSTYASEQFRAAIPVGRYGRPEEIAAAIAFAAADEASFLVGSNIVVDGGVTSGTGHPDLLEMFRPRGDS